ncbi:hypothetical protein [Streptomyces sp. NPDC055709]
METSTTTIEIAADGLTSEPSVGDDESLYTTSGEAQAQEGLRKPQRAGIVGGAASVVGVGLALVSLTGSGLGTVLSERQRLIGQMHMQASPGGQPGPIKQIFGAGWHMIATVNGCFALAALAVTSVVLFAARSAPPAVRAVAWGGLALGGIGLLLACGTRFDLFFDLPREPRPTLP